MVPCGTTGFSGQSFAEKNAYSDPGSTSDRIGASGILAEAGVSGRKCLEMSKTIGKK
jgi:hypothetical protein